MTSPLGARELRAMLVDGEELALLDVREELIFSQAHLLHARSVPLSRLELRIAALVPRRGVRLVLCDASDGLSERAADVLAENAWEVDLLERVERDGSCNFQVSQRRD